MQRKLFGGIPPVGETIRIAGQPFEIVGVLEEKVQLSNYNRPDKYCIFIPWTTMSGLTDTQLRRHLRLAGGVAGCSSRRPTQQVRELLANRYRYDPADERAAEHVRVGADAARSPAASSAG